MESGPGSLWGGNAGSPSGDSQWDDGPSGRSEDGIRHRLRALFHPSDGERLVQELIATHESELEERSAQLTETLAELERREERTLQLRSAVEEMLRDGAIELDERRAELGAVAAELAARDESLRASTGSWPSAGRSSGAASAPRRPRTAEASSTGQRPCEARRGSADNTEPEPEQANLLSFH